MSATVQKLDVISQAAILLGNDRNSVDPEYARGIAEMVNVLVGTGSSDDVAATEEILWSIAGAPEKTTEVPVKSDHTPSKNFTVMDGDKITVSHSGAGGYVEIIIREVSSGRSMLVQIDKSQISEITDAMLGR